MASATRKVTTMHGLFDSIQETVEDRRKHVAWGKARPTLDPMERIDCDGRLIHWEQYGKCTAFGWEIDHIRPTILGGSDGPMNLRARHWMGNRSAGGGLAGIGSLYSLLK
jgi:hypothetical protein